MRLTILKINNRSKFFLALRKLKPLPLKDAVKFGDDLPYVDDNWHIDKYFVKEEFGDSCEFTYEKTPEEIAEEERWQNPYDREPLKTELKEAQIWLESLSEKDRRKYDILVDYNIVRA